MTNKQKCPLRNDQYAEVRLCPSKIWIYRTTTESSPLMKWLCTDNPSQTHNHNTHKWKPVFIHPSRLSTREKSLNEQKAAEKELLFLLCV